MKKDSSSCWNSSHWLLLYIKTPVALQDVAEMPSVHASHFFTRDIKKTHAQRSRFNQMSNCYCSIEDLPLVRTHFIKDMLFFTFVTNPARTAGTVCASALTHATVQAVWLPLLLRHWCRCQRPNKRNNISTLLLK